MPNEKEKKSTRVTKRSSTGIGAKKEPTRARDKASERRAADDARRAEKKQSAPREEAKKSTARGERSDVNEQHRERARVSEERTEVRSTARARGGDPNRTVHQLVPYALVCLAPFAAISFILRDLYGLDGSTGAFGNFLADFLCGLFGIAGYLVPFFMLVLGIRWRRFVRDGLLVRKLVLSTLFVLLLSGIIHVFQDTGARGIMDTASRTLYDMGVIRAGGGLLGGFVGEWMGYIFRLPGTCLLAIPLLLILSIYLVGLTPIGLWERISYKLRVMHRKREERRAAMYEGKREAKAKAAPTEATSPAAAPVPDRSADWREPRAPEQVERTPTADFFTFSDEEDEPLRPVRHRELLDMMEDEPPVQEETVAPTPCPSPTPTPVAAPAAFAAAATAVAAEEPAPALNGHLVDAPFSPQYYQNYYADKAPATPAPAAESRTTDAGLGTGAYAIPVPEKPRSTAPSRVTDPGFTAERLERMAANNPTPGVSRVTDPGFGAERVASVTSGNTAPGTSRVTDAGFGMNRPAAPAAAAPTREPERTEERIDPRITEPSLGLAYGDRYTAVAEHHAAIYGERIARVASPEALRGTPVAPFGTSQDTLDEDPLLEREPAVATGMPSTPVSPFGAEEALREDEEVTATVQNLREDLFARPVQRTPISTAFFVPDEEENDVPEETVEATPATVSAEENDTSLPAEESNDDATAPEQPEEEEKDGKWDATIIRREPEKAAPPAAKPAAQAAPAPQKPAEPEPEPPRPYVFPPVDLLSEDMNRKNVDHSAEIYEKIEILRKTLSDFRINIKDQVDCSRGPTITRYEVRLEGGVSMRQIQNRIDDISLYMSAPVRIAAVPGKPAVGIEVPNTVRDTVYMRTMLESETFRSSKKPMEVPLGLDIGGAVQLCDLAAMPHLLIAGTTGSGKSVCINTILLSLIYKTSPEDLRLILIDPKQIEFAPYEHVPHLYMPIVTDMQRAAGALACAVQEMERRFSLIKDVGVRDIQGYNEAVKNDPEREHLPRILIVIDEFADLKMSCANNDPENFTCRLAQKARAAGIHLIIGTQRPSVDVITGKLKTNIASRIAFMVKQQVDSRTILDMNGAEMLAGRGDMLFAPANTSDKQPRRIQGAFVSDSDLERVISYVRRHNDPVRYNQAFMDQIEVEMARAANTGKKDDFDDLDESEDGEDPKFREAVELAVQTQKVATSLLQRRLGVGYGRAAKIIDRMEELGLVTPAEGNKPRKLLPAAQGYLDHMDSLDSAEDYDE